MTRAKAAIKVLGGNAAQSFLKIILVKKKVETTKK